MSNNPKLKELEDERREIVQRIRGLPFDEAWQAVRRALESSLSLYGDKHVLTVYEGPTRTFLLPLPFELLRDFMEHRGAAAVDYLFAHTGDVNPLVAAYCLHALSELEYPRLPEAAARVADRPEKIHTIYGCFGWEGTLSEYGQKLVKEYFEQD